MDDYGGLGFRVCGLDLRFWGFWLDTCWGLGLDAYTFGVSMNGGPHG